MVHYRSSSLPSNWDISAVPKSLDMSYICLELQSEDFYCEPLKDIKDKTGHNFRLESNDLFKSAVTKYLIRLEDPFFHVIYDSLALILTLHKLDPDAIFILYRPRRESESSTKIYDYFEELFNFKSLKYVMLHPAKDETTNDMGYYSPVIETFNYLDIVKYLNRNDMYFTLDDHLLVSREILSHLGPSSVSPYRKVYLSRSHINHRRYKTRKDHVGHKDDIRLDNEELLEDFFTSKGYDIVVPEMKFKTFREQLEYMRSVKVLASVTSSGITNALFMEDGQFVIEIVAELVFPAENLTTKQTLFSNYIETSYEKLHTHIYLPSRRDPKPVIEVLKTLVDALN
jgi:hypothetical protein